MERSLSRLAHPRYVAALALAFVLAACAEPETLPGTTCEEAFAQVPVIGNLETLDEFEEAMREIDVTIAACETVEEWTMAAEERFEVEVSDPQQFIAGRCLAAAPPVAPAPVDASPPIDPSPPLVLPSDTPICLEAGGQDDST